ADDRDAEWRGLAAALCDSELERAEGPESATHFDAVQAAAGSAAENRPAVSDAVHICEPGSLRAGHGGSVRGLRNQANRHVGYLLYARLVIAIDVDLYR